MTLHARGNSKYGNTAKLAIVTLTRTSRDQTGNKEPKDTKSAK